MTPLQIEEMSRVFPEQPAPIPSLEDQLSECARCARQGVKYPAYPEAVVKGLWQEKGLHINEFPRWAEEQFFYLIDHEERLAIAHFLRVIMK